MSLKYLFFTGIAFYLISYAFLLFDYDREFNGANFGNVTLSWVGTIFTITGLGLIIFAIVAGIIKFIRNLWNK